MNDCYPSRIVRLSIIQAYQLQCPLLVDFPHKLYQHSLDPDPLELYFPYLKILEPLCLWGRMLRKVLLLK